MLVIATGCEAVYDEVPGLEEVSETPYTREGATRMFKRLRDFEGGKVAVVVGVPHKCPIAPIYECDVAAIKRQQNKEATSCREIFIST